MLFVPSAPAIILPERPAIIRPDTPRRQAMLPGIIPVFNRAAASGPIGVPTTVAAATPTGAGPWTTTTTAAIAGGTLLVVTINSNQQTAASISSVTVGVDTLTSGIVQPGGSTTQQTAVYYKENASAQSSGVTVTVNLSGSTGGSTDARLYAFQVSGILTSSSLDKTATGTGGTSLSIATGTLGQAKEIIIGSMRSGTNSAITQTNNGFTSLDAINTSSVVNFSAATAYQIVSSTGTVTYNPTWGTSSGAGGVIATFKGN